MINCKSSHLSNNLYFFDYFSINYNFTTVNSVIDQTKEIVYITQLKYEHTIVNHSRI